MLVKRMEIYSHIFRNVILTSIFTVTFWKFDTAITNPIRTPHVFPI